MTFHLRKKIINKYANTTPYNHLKNPVILSKENTSIHKKNQFKNQESRKLPFLFRLANNIKISTSLDDIRPDY